MQLLRGLHNPGLNGGQSVATIGNFDGVHRGHQAILDQLRQQSSRLGLPSVVVLFEPQPLEFFQPELAPPRLMSLREKFEVLAQQGIDYLCCLKFDAALSRLSAQAFIERVLLQQLGIRHLVVGDDFRFGDGRTGDFRFLQAVGQQSGFTVEHTATLMDAGARISSTRIRKALAQADFASAAQMLGRPYQISGKVVHGAKLGRTLGFPTANIALARSRVALSGVFLVQVSDAAGASFYGVANVGTKPTVAGQSASLEVHLFDCASDLYGQRLRVRFLQKLRDEQRFASLAALQQQIALDAAQGRSLINTNAGWWLRR